MVGFVEGLDLVKHCLAGGVATAAHQTLGRRDLGATV
jgi:hypothetical protein